VICTKIAEAPPSHQSPVPETVLTWECSLKSVFLLCPQKLEVSRLLFITRLVYLIHFKVFCTRGFDLDIQQWVPGTMRNAAFPVLPRPALRTYILASIQGDWRAQQRLRSAAWEHVLHPTESLVFRHKHSVSKSFLAQVLPNGFRILSQLPCGIELPGCCLVNGFSSEVRPHSGGVLCSWLRARQGIKQRGAAHHIRVQVILSRT
jgi:hypothetical protein